MGLSSVYSRNVPGPALADLSISVLPGISDLFDRANSATVGNGWADQEGGVWSILNNQLKATTKGGDDQYAREALTRQASENAIDHGISTIVVAQANQSVSADLVLRYQVGGSYYFCAWQGLGGVNGNISIFKITNGGSLVNLNDQGGLVSKVATHTYRLEATAIGVNPTEIQFSIYDLGINPADLTVPGTLVGSTTAVDYTPGLQVAGAVGLLPHTLTPGAHPTILLDVVNTYTYVRNAPISTLHLGDSNTQFSDPTQSGMTGLVTEFGIALQKLLPGRTIHTCNRGAGGATSASFTNGQANLEDAITAALLLPILPQYASIMLGTNDALSSVRTSAVDYRTNLISCCDRLRAAIPTLKGILLNAPPFVSCNASNDNNAHFYDTIGQALIRDGYIPALASVAAHYGDGKVQVGDTTLWEVSKMQPGAFFTQQLQTDGGLTRYQLHLSGAPHGAGALLAGSLQADALKAAFPTI